MEGRMEGGKEGEGWREGRRSEGGRSEGGGSEWWAVMGACRHSRWWAMGLSPSFSSSVIVLCRHCPSLSFVVIIQQCHPSVLVVAGGRRSSLASGGGRFRSSVVMVVCICRCPWSFVGGWGGCSSSLVGLPGLQAVVRGLVSPPHVLISADQQGHFSDQC